MVVLLGSRVWRGCHWGGTSACQCMSNSIPPHNRRTRTHTQKERLTALPQYIVQNHIQVVNHNGTFYHLNPDLVFNVNQIVLCCVCAENPMTKDQESIAAGNDYG